MPVAMAIGSLVFYSVVAFGRAAGFAPKFAEMGRYLHVALALLLPAVAVATDGHPQMALPARTVACCTSSRFRPTWRTWKPCTSRRSRGRNGTSSSSLDPQAIDGLPAHFRPFARNSITVGWLREQRAAGRIPDPAGPVTEVDDANTFHVIALSGPESTRPTRCLPLRRPEVRVLRHGQTIRFRGMLFITTSRPGRWPLLHLVRSKGKRSRRGSTRSR